MRQKQPSFIQHFLITRLTSGKLLLSLDFLPPSIPDLNEKWLETLADLPPQVQQRLEAVDCILTRCKQQGLCHNTAIPLKGMDFYDAALETYANGYVHCPEERLENNESIADSTRAQFTAIAFQGNRVVIEILPNAGDEQYISTLTRFLAAQGLAAQPIFCKKTRAGIGLRGAPRD